MTRLSWWLVDVLARALEPGEREAVRGDFAESGETAAQALRDLLGLIVRRQAALWKHWRPWLAMFGLVGIAGAPLSKLAFAFSGALYLQLLTYWRHGVHFETGLSLGEDIVCLTCLSLGLLAWSWTSGFVLGSLSGRAIWITGALFYLALDSFNLRLLFSGAAKFHNARIPWLILAGLHPLSTPAVLLVLPAAIWGVRRGLRERTLPFGQTLILAVAVITLTSLVVWTGGWYGGAHETWSGGLWRGEPLQERLPPLALVTWPVGYMLATSGWRRWKENHA